MFCPSVDSAGQSAAAFAYDVENGTWLHIMTME